MRRRALLAAWLLTATAAVSAQQTIVVDINGGGQFTDLPEAIAAANPGDTLMVKAGVYSPFTLDKGLRILGEPGVTAGSLLQSFSISNLPAGHPVVIREVNPDALLAPAPILVDNNVGYVHLEDISAAAGVIVSDCMQVSMHRVSATGGQWAGAMGAVDVTNSTLLMSECPLSGAIGLAASSPGLFCSNSTVIYSEGVCQGGQGHFRAFAATGIRQIGGDLTIAGDSATAVRAGAQSPFGEQLGAIETTGGVLNVDPAVALLSIGGAPTIVGEGTAVTTDHVASLQADVASQVLSARLFAPGTLQAFLVGSVVRIPPLQTPFGPFWFTNSHLVLDAGPVVGEVRQVAIPLPVLTAGSFVVLQSVVVRAGVGPEMSMPVVLTVDG